jgi:hypothetical protein
LQALTDEEIMSTMLVTVVFEFENVEPGSPEDEEIWSAIDNDCRALRADYDASQVYVKSTDFKD